MLAPLDASFWLSWNRSDLLALIAVTATVLIPVILHRIGKESEQKADEANRHLQSLQDELLKISTRARRDEIMKQLTEVSDPRTFALLREEAEQFDGRDRELLRSAYRQNPLEALPYDGHLTERDLDDYISSLKRRLANSSDAYKNRSQLVNFACFLCREFPGKEHELTGPLFAASHNHPIAHTFYWAFVSDAHWRMAPALIYSALDNWDHAHPFRGTNLLTGVFVGLIEIDRRPGGGGSSLTVAEDLELQLEMLRALASLIHRGPLTGIAHWTSGAPPYTQGSSEPLSALVAWMIRAIGNAVQKDDHLEMRIIESLAPIVRSLKSSRDPTWGMDDEDVQLGLLRIRAKCPNLWSQYGDKLLQETGLRLAPRISRKSKPTDLFRGFAGQPTESWPEPFDDFHQDDPPVNPAE